MKLPSIILTSALAFSGHALADAAAGQSAFAAKGCIGCHGAGGVSVVPAYPSLKGKDEAKYRKYKSHIFILQAVKYHPIISHLS